MYTYMNPLMITDLLKKIGSYKHDLEREDNLKQMYAHEIFQDILAYLWLGITGVTLIYKRKNNEDRMKISTDYFQNYISFNLYHKHKKKHFYCNSFEMASYKQLALDVMEDEKLLSFFKDYKRFSLTVI